MCRIPDESGKVRKKIIRRNFKINFYTNRIKLNDEDDESWEWLYFFVHNFWYYLNDFVRKQKICSLNNYFLIQDSKNRRFKSKRDVWLISRKNFALNSAIFFFSLFFFPPYSYIVFIQLGKLISVEPQDSLAGLPSSGGHLYKNKAIPSWILCVSRDGIISIIRASNMVFISIKISLYILFFL